MKITVADVKASTIPAAVGLASCDARFLALVNEAQQRIVMGPEAWWECYQRYRFQVTSGMVTWPRQVANIIQVAVDCNPYVIRNEWFEFLDTGYGIRKTTSLCDNQLIDRGTSCLINDINTDGNDKTLKLYSMVAETAGQTFGILGWDSDGDWVRTNTTGTWVDGEWLAIPTDPTAPTQSGRYWSSIQALIMPVTNGEKLLYEYDDTAGVQRKIGHYESDETRPRYRRSLVGAIGNGVDSTTAHTITAMVKLDHLQLRNDNDFLLIGNMPALKEMCMSIIERERKNLDAAENYRNECFRLMDREAGHYIGTSARTPINVNADCWGLGEVPYLQ